MNPTLLERLQDASLFDHPVDRFEVIETHISWVLLTGDYAYKIKKPVNFGFVDFSTLEKRRHFCFEELRLNRRLAPDLYLDVKAVTASENGLRVCATNNLEQSTAVEYMVQMRQFDQQGMLDQVQKCGTLTEQHIDQLGDIVANFHQRTEISTELSQLGTPDHIWPWVEQNFSQISSRLDKQSDQDALNDLLLWSRSEWQRLNALFRLRKESGFVRDCHGDLHLGNITLIDNQVTVFDCIEFNDELRFIDVISEISFTLMDLDYRGEWPLSHRLLDRYLAGTGDYQGLELLRFYLVYRAMVRAKVAILRSTQVEAEPQVRTHALEEFRQHLNLSQRYRQQQVCAIILTSGLAGSGKSSLAQHLIQHNGLMRLRSDVERKRIHGMDALSCSDSSVQAGIYNPESNKATYERLLDLAKYVVSAGYPVIVDATFLKQQQREPFQRMATELGVSFVILSLEVDHAILRDRIVQRQQTGEDPSEAGLEVLDYQISNAEPFSPSEQQSVIAVGSHRRDYQLAAQALSERLYRNNCK